AGGGALEPYEQRRADVEADRLQGVNDGGDAAVGGVTPRGDHRPVALLVDALVPVVKRRRGRLTLHFLQPGILARWLVEMRVHHCGMRGRSRHPMAEAGAEIAADTASRTSGNTVSRCHSSSAGRATLSSPPEPNPGRRGRVSSQCRMKRRWA